MSTSTESGAALRWRARETEWAALGIALVLLIGCAAGGPGRSDPTAAAGEPDAQRFGFGSAASAQELAAFRSPLPDGRGLPAGRGSVAEGEALYLQRCAACHGANLEGAIGDRLIGGRGLLASGTPAKAPVKTVESYWPHATTLFDYVKRAMPMDAPGTLSDSQVYAVSAYVLARAGIVGSNAVLDAQTLAAVRMPNRDGFIADPRPEKLPPPDPQPRLRR